jgi:hypothetical protein
MPTSSEDRDDIEPGAGAPRPGTDSPVDEWFGQSANDDAELADKLVDAVGVEEAERQFADQAQGKSRQEARHGDHLDPHQGEHLYRNVADGPGRSDRRTGRSSDSGTTPRHLLGIYLRDHHAAASAGVALAHRCHRNNLGSEFERELRDLANEIERDADRLSAAMAGIDVEPSRIKEAAARAAELIARLKSNGRLVDYSPSSRVLEFEGLRAGIAAKRQLWRSLTVTTPSPLDPTELAGLAERADRQLAVVDALHERAARAAFAD